MSNHACGVEAIFYQAHIFGKTPFYVVSLLAVFLDFRFLFPCKQPAIFAGFAAISISVLYWYFNIDFKCCPVARADRSMRCNTDDFFDSLYVSPYKSRFKASILAKSL